MADLLRIDSSVRGEDSVSRALTGRAAERWSAKHARATVVHRDLGDHPLPHLTNATDVARMVDPATHTATRAESYQLTRDLIDEVRAASAIVIGMPLYNYGLPSSLKAWVDLLVAPGLSSDPVTRIGSLSGGEVMVFATRGGGYRPGSPREGWDHAGAWLSHALSQVGLAPQLISVDLTLAQDYPHLAHLQPLAAQSLRRAQEQIDGFWAAVAA
jgi:FMN-dependent NADH-azoreductase